MKNVHTPWHVEGKSRDNIMDDTATSTTYYYYYYYYYYYTTDLGCGFKTE